MSGYGFILEIECSKQAELEMPRSREKGFTVDEIRSLSFALPFLPLLFAI